MADQTFNVFCGFFDAINDDRTYYADDMNRPYKRLVANGVFATPSGTPSTDLQVTAGTGRTVVVAAGEGIFADKWFENPSALSITVPSVTGLGRRIDSVLVQVDERAAGRVGSIVYRTGTAGSNPVPPSINQIAGVTEYRLANITSFGSGSIQPANIDDLRGSAECPWVTALIQQVDTSALWDQYQRAYRESIDIADETFYDWFSGIQQDWSIFIQQLQSDLTVNPNTIVLTSSFTPSSAVSEIPIGIASYDATTDALLVFVNGFMAERGVFWNPSQNAGNITYSGDIEAGDRVDFICLKSIVTSALGNVQDLITELDRKVDAATEDSGWSATGIVFQNGAANYDEGHNKVMWRKKGDLVSLRGAFKGLTSEGRVFSIPLDEAPEESLYFPTCALNSGTITANVMIQIRNDGYAYLYGINGTIGADDQIPVCFDWLIG